MDRGYKWKGPDFKSGYTPSNSSNNVTLENMPSQEHMELPGLPFLLYC